MELVLLFGSISAVLLEIYKWLVGKFGADHTKEALYLGSFLLSILYAILLRENIISLSMLAWIGGVMATATGVYEIVIKNFNTYLSKNSNG